MSVNLASRRKGLLGLLAVLGGLLAYAYLPEARSQLTRPGHSQPSDSKQQGRARRSGSRLPRSLAEWPRATRRGSSRPWFRLWQTPNHRFASPQSAPCTRPLRKTPWPGSGYGTDSLAAGHRPPRSRHGGRSPSTLKPEPKLAIPELIAALHPADESRSSAPAAPIPSAGAMTAQNSIDRNQKDHARASAVTALGVIGGHDPLVQETLLHLAGDPVPEVRMVVARTLGDLGSGNPRGPAAELKLASDPDLYIQARAVTALGNFPLDYTLSCPSLYRAYLSKQRPLQEGAELSLEKIVKSKTFDVVSAMKSKDASLRFVAVFGLDPGSDAGFQALVKALGDEDPGVRIMAAARIARVPSNRTASALNALESLSKDANPDVVSQMQHSLSFLKPRPARPTGR